jgi:hypothetical protein
VPAAEDTNDAAVKKELANLLGTWKLVACKAEGEKVPEKILTGKSCGGGSPVVGFACPRMNLDRQLRGLQRNMRSLEMP